MRCAPVEVTFGTVRPLLTATCASRAGEMFGRSGGLRFRETHRYGSGTQEYLGTLTPEQSRGVGSTSFTFKMGSKRRGLWTEVRIFAMLQTSR